MKTTLGRKLAVGYGAMFLLALLLSFVGLRNIGLLEAEIRGPINDMLTRLDATGGSRSALLEMVAAQRALVIWTLKADNAGISNSIETFENALERVRTDLNQFREGELPSGELRAIERLDAGLERWRPLFDRMVELCRRGDVAAASDFETEIEPITDDLLAAAKSLAEAQSRRYGRARNNASKVARDARWIAFVLLALTLLAGGVIIASYFRSTHRVLTAMVADLQEGAKQVAGAAEQVSGVSQSLAQTSSDQAASLEETSASAQELSRMTDENARSAKDSAALMAQAGETIEEANRSLEKMMASMGEINTSSEKISKIIKVIDEIAFQTNILALNAAVEAARAGDAGKGFAVVADEVRNLAQRSGQAAKDTARLIEESISRSRDGSLTLDQVASNIEAITNKAVDVKDLVERVSSGSLKQALGIKEISGSVDRMADVTQRAAATAQETAAAGQQLRSHASIVNRALSQLESLVGDPSRSAVRRRSPEVENDDQAPGENFEEF